VGATGRGVPSVSGTLFALVVVGAAWAAGQALRFHSARAQRLTVAVSEEQQRARAAAQEERTRIARELHDIVTHAVSIMVIQAGAAGEVLPSRPDDAGEALLAIQRTGRQALDELRRLLGVLHDETATAELSPQPGLAELPGLVDQTRQAGVAVTLAMDEHLPEAPVSLGLAVYRIVQEALTNVVKHAHAARADVTVTHRGDALEVRVVDDGRGDRSGGAHGHGLSGMAQRAAMFGGTLVAGDTPGSGFAVQVRLPLNAPAVLS
jgi:signal transduction histidine kinase